MVILQSPSYLEIAKTCTQNTLKLYKSNFNQKVEKKRAKATFTPK